MKKFIRTFSIFVLLSILINPTSVFAESEPKTLTQGICNVRNSNLLVNTPITIRTAPAKVAP